MSNAILNWPVVPSAWVHETHTVGTGSGASYLTSAPPFADLHQRVGQVARVSRTTSYHMAAEQHCLYMPAPEEPLSSLGLWLSHPIVAPDVTHAASDVRALPPVSGIQSPPPLSAALHAADDLRAWLHLTHREVATMSGLATRTIHHWRATGAQPRPATVRRLREIHASVDTLRRTLGPDRAGDWFRTGTPSPLQLLQAGDWGGVQEAMHKVLFRRPRRGRDSAGHSPYDPETDFAVGSQEFTARIEQHISFGDRALVLSLDFARR